MTDETKDAVAPLPLIDALGGPEIWADELAGVYLMNGVVRLTFASHRVDHTKFPGPVSRIVTGRLTMTAAGARAMLNTLTEFVGRIEAQVEKAVTEPVEH